MKKSKLIILSAAASLTIHILLFLLISNILKKEMSVMHKLPKHYYVDIVTLPKNQKPKIPKKKEQHKIAANIQRNGVAKKYSKKEKIPKKTVKIYKHQAKQIIIKKAKKPLTVHNIPKRTARQTKNASTKQKVKKFIRKKQPRTIKITGGLYNQKAVISRSNTKGFSSGNDKEYKYKNAKREATVSIGTQSLKYASYMKHIKDKVQNVWIYPQEARMNGQQGQLLILFSIGKKGELEKVVLLRSSSYSSLDRAAIQAVKDASPFPALPKRLHIDQLNIYAAFSYKLGFYYVE